MSRFDELLSQARDLANAAGKATGEMVEMSRLKLQAVQLNGEIRKAYERLGTVQYEQIKTGVDNADLVAVCVSEVDSLLAALSDLNGRIAATKDDIICPNCGARNPVGSVYCARCGSSLDGEPVAYSHSAIVVPENNEEIQMEEESL